MILRLILLSHFLQQKYLEKNDGLSFQTLKSSLDMSILILDRHFSHALDQVII